MRQRMVTLGGAALAILLAAQPGQAQPTPAPGPAATAATATAAAQAAAEPATLVYSNRVIVQFRGTLLMRPPSERAAAATYFIDRLVDSVPSARVSTQPLGDAVGIRLGDPTVFVILPADVNTLAGETLDGTAAAAASALQKAFDEAVELRSPGRLLHGGLLAIGATLIYMALLWLLRWIDRAVAQRVNQTTERQLGKLNAGAEILRASRIPEVLQRSRISGSRLSTNYVSTPSMSSTSTACRSHRQTTRRIRTGQRSSRPSAGTPRPLCFPVSRLG